MDVDRRSHVLTTLGNIAKKIATVDATVSKLT
jgi:hypothetical protein